MRLLFFSTLLPSALPYHWVRLKWSYLSFFCCERVCLCERFSLKNNRVIFQELRFLLVSLSAEKYSCLNHCLAERGTKWYLLKMYWRVIGVPVIMLLQWIIIKLRIGWCFCIDSSANKGIRSYIWYLQFSMDCINVGHLFIEQLRSELIAQKSGLKYFF